MKNPLRLAEGIALPLDAVTQTFLILGKRGSGKSSTATTMAEQMIRAKQTIAVLDPVDVWYGLKAGRDGRADGGLGVYVFGGDHADFPLEPSSGALMADILVDERISVIMVVRQFSNAEKARFVADFADRLYRRNREALHLFCEEAHEFMPQQPQRGEEVMLGRMLRLEKSGRTCGIGMSAITQRPPALSKTATTQAEVLIQHRVKGAQDIEAFRLWVRYNQEEERVEEILQSLASLRVGEAWWWSPGWPDDKPIDLQRVQFLMPETFDSRATPKAGQKVRAPKSLAPVDIERLKERMRETVERQRADDPRELRARIAQLERELRGAPKVSAAPPKVVVKREVVADARLLRVLESTTGKTEAAIATIRDMLAASEKVMVRLDAVGQRFRAGGDGQLTGKVTAEEFVRAGAPGLYLEGAAILGVRDGQVVVGPEARGRRPSVRLGPRSNVRGDARLGGPERSTVEVVTKEGLQEARATQLLAGERRMLQAIAQRHPIRMTRSQVGTLAGFTPSGGTFKNYLGRLKKFGLIREERDDVEVTARGFAYLGDDVPKAPSTTAELQELWRSKLLRGEREILDLLIRRYPDGMSREEIGQQAGFEASGGTFKNYLGTLKRNELAVERDGLVRASDTLFLERG